MLNQKAKQAMLTLHVLMEECPHSFAAAGSQKNLAALFGKTIAHHRRIAAENPPRFFILRQMLQ